MLEPLSHCVCMAIAEGISLCRGSGGRGRLLGASVGGKGSSDSLAQQPTTLRLHGLVVVHWYLYVLSVVADIFCEGVGERALTH